MTLPILLSVPHAGLRVPSEVKAYCRLSSDEIIADSDQGAAEIYDLKSHVAQFATTDIARSLVDVNRAADGVVKTHTCWEVPVYREFPPEEIIGRLLDKYYYPYHARLSSPGNGNIRLCVDCHTMAACGPPLGPDPGRARPHVCLGDVRGTTLPPGWTAELVACFRGAFGESVAMNTPFAGGYITRAHSRERPWVQLELSRASFLSEEEKRQRVLRALMDFCRRVLA